MVVVTGKFKNLVLAALTVTSQPSMLRTSLSCSINRSPGSDEVEYGRAAPMVTSNQSASVVPQWACPNIFSIKCKDCVSHKWDLGNIFVLSRCTAQDMNLQIHCHMSHCAWGCAFALLCTSAFQKLGYVSLQQRFSLLFLMIYDYVVPPFQLYQIVSSFHFSALWHVFVRCVLSHLVCVCVCDVWAWHV